MSLPLNINPCPIIESLFEIRFNSNINSNAVFGLIYNKLQSEYPNVENLPILQIPEALRTNDPGFKFKPFHKIYNENFIIQIGPEVLTISPSKEYLGWTNFSNKIIDTLKKIEELNIIKSIERIGLRYINFFELDIYDNIKVNINIDKTEINYKNTIFRTEIEHSESSSTLQIANNVLINDKTGSVIDIDTFTQNNINEFFSTKETIIEKIHQNEKSLFFSLLKEEFINTLNPNY
jgi:uncharacterized protein (TIGR04255 family)